MSRGQTRSFLARVAIGAAISMVGVTAGCSSSDNLAAMNPTTSNPTTASPVSDSVTSTSPDASAQATDTASAIPTDVVGPSASAAEAAPPPGTVPLPTTFITVDRSISDTVVGHTVAVSKIARHLSWPDGYQAQSAAFELVAVEMTWTAGATMTAPLNASSLAILSGSTYPNRRDLTLDPTLTAAGWTVMPAQLSPGEKLTGWMIFKVEPKDAASLALQLTRPAVRDASTGTTYAKEVVTLTLVG